MFTIPENVNVEDLRCIHRHRWPEHKSCFIKGLVTYKPRKQKKEKVEPEEKEPNKGTVEWFVKNNFRIGFLDIETDQGLVADFSTMLSWCIKDKGGKTAYDVITKAELFNLEFDERIVRSLVDEMRKYQVVVGYYSTNFDLPYLRTKALHYGINFPEYGEVYHWDLFYTVKSKLSLSRKSLDNACDYLGIEGKTPISKETWRRAKYGDPQALKKVLEHNVADVEITEKLFDKLMSFRKWIKTST